MVRKFQSVWSRDTSWVGTIFSALPDLGQEATQLPQLVQSSVETPMVYFRPARPGPLASTSVISTGAALTSPSSSRKGRMTAWGQTKEHILHWRHSAASHTGRWVAMPRFSYLEVPSGMVPSSMPLKAETGRSSPFWALMGTRMFLMT